MAAEAQCDTPCDAQCDTPCDAQCDTPCDARARKASIPIGRTRRFMQRASNG
jgi:hypothetical protein